MSPLLFTVDIPLSSPIALYWLSFYSLCDLSFHSFDVERLFYFFIVCFCWNYHSTGLIILFSFISLFLFLRNVSVHSFALLYQNHQPSHQQELLQLLLLLKRELQNTWGILPRISISVNIPIKIHWFFKFRKISLGGVAHCICVWQIDMHIFTWGVS